MGTRASPLSYGALRLLGRPVPEPNMRFLSGIALRQSQHSCLGGGPVCVHCSGAGLDRVALQHGQGLDRRRDVSGTINVSVALFSNDGSSYDPVVTAGITAIATAAVTVLWGREDIGPLQQQGFGPCCRVAGGLGPVVGTFRSFEGAPCDGMMGRCLDLGGCDGDQSCSWRTRCCG
jgi:hypothetical protein